jgi:hypothetical protein
LTVKRRITVFASVSLLLAGCVTGPARGPLPPFPKGLYSNVRMAQGSGDVGGFEARFYVDESGRHFAEFTFCEGWCNQAYIAEVTRDGDGFAFSHVETLIGRDQSGASLTEDHLVQYRVTPSGRSLRVAYTYDGHDMTGTVPWRITPRKRPYG